MDSLQYMDKIKLQGLPELCFKPCYKWNTFNTERVHEELGEVNEVLNLIITGIPSILKCDRMGNYVEVYVLNLIITGIPSILLKKMIILT